MQIERMILTLLIIY